MRKYLYAGALLLLAITLGGCGSGKSQPKATSNTSSGSSRHYSELRWGAPEFAGSIYWKKNVYVQAAWIDGLAIQNLLNLAPNGAVKLDLASSEEHPDPTTYIYTIRKGVKFSDGNPLMVEDVVYSLRSNITGKESVTKQYWEDVSSVAADGASRVIIKLKQPEVTWPKILAITGQIIEKAAAEKVGEKALGTPGGLMIGTGPWKFDSYKPEVSIQLSRNPYWTGTPPPAAKIAMDLFKSESAASLALRGGAIDGAFAFAPKQYLHIPDTRLQVAPGASTTFMAMNTKRAPFTDVHVRRAISYATDVPGMIKALYPPGDATENVTLIPSNEFASLGSPSEVDKMLTSLPRYAFNLTAAKSELAKSAYPHGFSMTLQTFAGSSVEVGAAQILSSDLAKIGITATVHELAPDEGSAIFGSPGKVTAFFVNYSGVYPDPAAILSQMLLASQIAPSGGGLNTAGYNNSQVEKLMTAQSETANSGKRLEMFGKLLATVGEEAPYRPLFTPGEFVALSNKYVFPTFSPWTVITGPWALDVEQVG